MMSSSSAAAGAGSSASIELKLLPIFQDSDMNAAIKEAFAGSSESSTVTVTLGLGVRFQHVGLDPAELLRRLGRYFGGDRDKFDGPHSRLFLEVIKKVLLNPDLSKLRTHKDSQPTLQLYLGHLLSGMGVVYIPETIKVLLPTTTSDSRGRGPRAPSSSSSSLHLVRVPLSETALNYLNLRMQKKLFFEAAKDTYGAMCAHGKNPLPDSRDLSQCSFLAQPVTSDELAVDASGEPAAVASDEPEAVRLMEVVCPGWDGLTPEAVLRQWQKDASEAMTVSDPASGTPASKKEVAAFATWLMSEDCYNMYIDPLVVSWLGNDWYSKDAIMMASILLSRHTTSSPICSHDITSTSSMITPFEAQCLKVALQCALIFQLAEENLGKEVSNLRRARLASAFTGQLSSLTTTTFWIIPIGLPGHATYMLVHYDLSRSRFRLLWFNGWREPGSRTMWEPDDVSPYGKDFEYRLVPVQCSQWLRVEGEVAFTMANPHSTTHEVKNFSKAELFELVFGHLASIKADDHSEESRSLHIQFPDLFVLSGDIFMPVQSVGNCTLWNLHQAIRFGCGWAFNDGRWLHFQMAMLYEAVRLRFSPAPSEVSFELPV